MANDLTYCCIISIAEKLNICADLNVVTLLTGLQCSNNKYCCFLGEWISRARNLHDVVKERAIRKNIVPGLQYIHNESLIDEKNRYLRPLHIKQGRITNFSRRKYCSHTSRQKNRALTAFKSVCSNFIDDKKSENLQDLVDELIQCYKTLGCNKSHAAFLDSHLKFFPVNLGALSDEHGKSFHQHIAQLVKRYNGKWTSNISC